MILFFVAVGAGAAGFPAQGNDLELRAGETQPALGAALWGLQPGRLPRRPGGPPQHQRQVGQMLRTR